MGQIEDSYSMREEANMMAIPNEKMPKEIRDFFRLVSFLISGMRSEAEM